MTLAVYKIYSIVDNAFANRVARDICKAGAQRVHYPAWPLVILLNERYGDVHVVREFDDRVVGNADDVLFKKNVLIHA
jgi:hypothetical protein